MRYRAWLFVLNRTAKGIWKPEKPGSEIDSFLHYGFMASNQSTLMIATKDSIEDVGRVSRPGAPNI